MPYKSYSLPEYTFLLLYMNQPNGKPKPLKKKQNFRITRTEISQLLRNDYIESSMSIRVSKKERTLHPFRKPKNLLPNKLLQ